MIGEIVMDKLLISYLTVNAVGLAILLIIYLFMRKRSEIFAVDQKLFMGILGATAILIILDAAEWILDGQTTKLAIFLLRPIYVLYYIMNPTVGALWFLYVFVIANEDLKKLKWRWALFLAPFIINIILSILSYWFDIFFTINEENIYTRGKLFHIETIISYGYLLASIILVIIVRKQMKREKVLTLILYVAIPSMVGAIQILFYGVNLIWISSSIATLIVFISLQSRSSLVDYLTGVYNRKHLENYLSWRVKNRNNQNFIMGIMIDIDKFKNINDQYGHIAGDKALEDTAEILYKSLKKKDFLARYAGDEFVIVLENNDKDYVYQVIENMEKNLKIHNEQPENPFIINFSYGYHVFGPTENFDFKHFIDMIDQKMYKNKRIKYEKLDLTR